MTEGSDIETSEDIPFVVLRHSDQGGDHFDLMIDQGSHLATWKFQQAPETVDTVLVCRRIFDHRRFFLDYEGPLSGDKGSVSQHDRGHCRILGCADDEWNVSFLGKHLVGRFDLVKEADTDSEGPDQSWSFRARPSCEINDSTLSVRQPGSTRTPNTR